MVDKVKINPSNFVTDELTFSHAHVFESKPNPSGKMKYSSCLLLEKTNKEEKERWDAAVEAAIQQGIAKGCFTANQRAILKLPVRDGDLEVKQGSKKAGQGYEGRYFVNANSDDPPQVQKPANGIAIAISDPLEFFSGCKGRAIISFYPFPKPGSQNVSSRGIAVGLNGVYKTGEGARMDGRVDASSVFSKFAEEEVGDTDDGENSFE